MKSALKKDTLSTSSIIFPYIQGDPITVFTLFQWVRIPLGYIDRSKVETLCPNSNCRAPGAAMPLRKYKGECVNLQFPEVKFNPSAYGLGLAIHPAIPPCSLDHTNFFSTRAHSPSHCNSSIKRNKKSSQNSPLFWVNKSAFYMIHLGCRMAYYGCFPQASYYCVCLITMKRAPT